MAENYNLGARFGFNIASQNAQQSAPQTKKEIDFNTTVSEIIDNATSYIAKNERVFNGEIANEINMYSRQAMIVGMNLRAADKPHHNLDINM